MDQGPLQRIHLFFAFPFYNMLTALILQYVDARPWLIVRELSDSRHTRARPRKRLVCRGSNVQPSIEKFYWSKALQKTRKFPFNLNIKVPLGGVNLFLYVLPCLKVILTMEHYTKLLIIIIWRYAIGFFSRYMLFGAVTTCPNVIFLLTAGLQPLCLIYLCCWLGHVFGKRAPFKII